MKTAWTIWKCKAGHVIETALPAVAVYCGRCKNTVKGTVPPMKGVK